MLGLTVPRMFSATQRPTLAVSSRGERMRAAVCSAALLGAKDFIQALEDLADVFR